MVRKKNAFTLIELLVVISIIALLLSILVPALNRAKESGKRAVCLANLKSLTLAWMMYAEDNSGKISSAKATDTHLGGTIKNGWVEMLDAPYTKEPTEAPLELQVQAIKNGVLFDYIEAEDVYRCPVGKKNEMRTYSASTGMIGAGTAHPPQWIMNINEIRRTVSRIVFLDDYAQNWDARWLIYNDRAQWWNPIPARHGKGTTVSFADGHAEWWDWKDNRTLDWATLTWDEAEKRRETLSPQPDNQDIIRIQKAIWGKLKY